MELTDDQRAGLGTALNEAALLGLEVDADERLAAATFAVLTLPEQGAPPGDPRVQFLFEPVGRVAASLRHGVAANPEIEPFAIADLLSVVQSFNGQRIYGWKFFDIDAPNLPKWIRWLSLDWRSGDNGTSHTISLFQEEGDRHLDVCLWFDSFVIRKPTGEIIELEEFCAGGERWWDAMHRGDPRTADSGIAPLKGWKMPE